MIRRNSTISGGGRLRPLATPRAIRVRADAHEQPVAVWSGGRWNRIEAIRERWRIDDEWWRDPVSREYHVVVLQGGRLATIYRDRLRSTWFLQS